MIPPHVDEASQPQRLRALLALEISRIVDDLEQRKEFLVQMWSVHRKREPFLETVFSRWTTLNFEQLGYLDLEELVIVEGFYRELDEFRLYIRFTQDMPNMLSNRYDTLLKRLEAYGRLAIEALGGAPERPMVEIDDDDDDLLFQLVPEGTLADWPLLSQTSGGEE